MGNPLRPVGVASYDEYLAGGFEYAIVSGERYETFWPGSPASKAWPSFAAFYAELFRRGRLIQEFSDVDGKLRGPTIRIYRFAGGKSEPSIGGAARGAN